MMLLRRQGWDNKFRISLFANHHHDGSFLRLLSILLLSCCSIIFNEKIIMIQSFVIILPSEQLFVHYHKTDLITTTTATYTTTTTTTTTATTKRSMKSTTIEEKQQQKQKHQQQKQQRLKQQLKQLKQQHHQQQKFHNPNTYVNNNKSNDATMLGITNSYHHQLYQVNSSSYPIVEGPSFESMTTTRTTTTTTTTTTGTSSTAMPMIMSRRSCMILSAAMITTGTFGSGLSSQNAEAVEAASTTSTISAIPKSLSSSKIFISDYREDDVSTSASSSTTSISSSSNVVDIKTVINWDDIIKKASKKALGGGKAGATAAIVQVLSLMWLRTCMNYQYRYGGTLSTSLTTLYKQGGISRLYQGLPFALIQGPFTRFGDTAANVGILALLETIPETSNWPLPIKTGCGSILAGLWRIVLMPIDTCKTVMQVEGSNAIKELWTNTIPQYGINVLYRGSIAQAAATAVGHFPWFITYNYLDNTLPRYNDDPFLSLCRSALLGLSASCVSDCSSNSLRVIKTTKQTASFSTNTNNQINNVTEILLYDNNNGSNKISSNETSLNLMPIVLPDDIVNSNNKKIKQDDGVVGNNNNNNNNNRELTYPEVIALIIEKDGIIGLFGRGLQTRLITNAIQGAAFSVLWRYFQQQNQ